MVGGWTVFKSGNQRTVKVFSGTSEECVPCAKVAISSDGLNPGGKQI